MTETKNTDPRNVTVDQVLETARECGAVVANLKSFWAIEAPEYNKKAIYVGKAKRRMTRLDFAGFEGPEHGAISHLTEEDAKELKLGAVRGQILPKEIREEDVDVLEAVRLLVASLLDPTEGFKLGKRKAKEPVAEEATTEETDSSEGGEEEVDPAVEWALGREEATA